MVYEVNFFQIFLFASSVLTAGYAALTDIRFHKIYNHTTIPMMLAGLIFRLLFCGPLGFLDGLAGIVLGAAMGIFWFLGMLKAGDIKLYMAIGALGGARFCLITVIGSILAGGIFGAILMLLKKDGRQSFQQLKNWFINLIYTRKFYHYEPASESVRLSFGICIFIGAILAVAAFKDKIMEEIFHMLIIFNTWR